MAIILEANQICQRIEKDNLTQLSLISTKLSLASVGVGQDNSANLYQLSQQKAAQKLGINYIPLNLPSDISYGDFKAQVDKINRDGKIDGIILNKPFPTEWKAKDEDVFSLISDKKDVEGMHPLNRGRFFSVDKQTVSSIIAFSSLEHLLISPTVLSVIAIINESFRKVNDTEGYRGKRVTLVGFSLIIGKMLVLFLGNELATVSVTHLGTDEKGDLPEYLRSADIVISAVGKPHLIKGEWIKKGAIVIDVGTAVEDGKAVGDMDFDKVKERAAVITPVPGGVGKLTVMFLYHNLILAHKLKSK